MSSLLDETMRLVYSSSNTLHVKDGSYKTACGRDCFDNYKWQYGGLTTLRKVARMSQALRPNYLCKACARIYKDVNVNG